MTWQTTEVSRRLRLAAPLIQGPFGSGLSAVELVVAVCEAGMLGSFGVHHLDRGSIAEVARQIRSRTQRSFALNLWIPLVDEGSKLSDEVFAAASGVLRPYFDQLGLAMPMRLESIGSQYEEQIEAVLEARPAVFSFVYGIPSSQVLARCRELNIVTLGAATTPAEAIALESAGVDMIVASGFEAGGHRVSFLRPPEECLTGTLSLIPQVVDAVKVPVIAAGGIADGRGIAAALMLGAQGAQIGTAFLACEESSASPLHRERLFSTGATQTVLTKIFTGRLARGIRNGLTTALDPHESQLAPYPMQAWLTAQLKMEALKAGRADLMPLWCGQSAPLLRHRKARELIDSLVEQTSSTLNRYP